MFGLPLHPSVVHLPIGLAVVMPLVAAFLAVAIWKKWLPRRAWLTVIMLQAVLVIGAFASLLSGEDEERETEYIVGDAAISEHEEAAQAFTWLTVAALAVAGTAGALAGKPKIADLLGGATVLVTCAVLGLGGYVGHLGGKLVYEKGAASAYTGPVAPAPTGANDD